jgi:hypothetical protein
MAPWSKSRCDPRGYRCSTTARVLAIPNRLVAPHQMAQFNTTLWIVSITNAFAGRPRHGAQYLRRESDYAAHAQTWNFDAA